MIYLFKIYVNIKIKEMEQTTLLSTSLLLIKKELSVPLNVFIKELGEAFILLIIIFIAFGMLFFLMENVKSEFKQLVQDVFEWIWNTLLWIIGIPRNIYNTISSILYNIGVEIAIQFNRFLDLFTAGNIFKSIAVVIACPCVIFILFHLGTIFLELVEAFCHWLWEIFMSVFVLIGIQIFILHFYQSINHLF